MNNQPKNANLIEAGYRQADNLDLIIYFRKLWVWKWLILGIPLSCMVAAALFSAMLPKIHQSSMVIKPGVIGTKNDGSPISVDPVVNMKGNIENGIFNSKIVKELDGKFPITNLQFKVLVLQGPELLRISSEWERDAADTGEKVLSLLYSELHDYYAKVTQEKLDEVDQEIMPRLGDLAKIEMERKDLGKQISLRLSNIQSSKEQINFLSSEIKKISVKKNKLIQEIDQIKRANESLVQQKNRIIEDKDNRSDHASILLYFLTSQQNAGYLIDLNERLDTYDSEETLKRLQVTDLYTKIDEHNLAKELLTTQQTDGLQNKINDVQIQIDKLNKKKNKIENIKMISEPKTSASAVKPKPMLNVVLSGAAGFVIAIFAAFFIEYFRRVLRGAGREKISKEGQN